MPWFLAQRRNCCQNAWTGIRKNATTEVEVSCGNFSVGSCDFLLMEKANEAMLASCEKGIPYPSEEYPRIELGSQIPFVSGSFLLLMSIFKIGYLS